MQDRQHESSKSTSFTVIWRHRRENKKKCSLRGLESHPDFQWISYPTGKLPSLKNFLFLKIDAPVLEKGQDCNGIFILDATWTLVNKMAASIEDKQDQFIYRSLPPDIHTAYPRKQTGCIDPGRGLATIEAIFTAYLILGRSVEGILDHYVWKEKFIKLNNFGRKEVL